jgi:endonuclease/exonuclease/phosphatase family metal-dependent hydrolase
VYLQVNRSLEREFADTIAAAEWSVCLLQETPPGWVDSLAARCGAVAVKRLTSRNLFLRLTSWIARLRPDLLGAWEGGSNVALVRHPWQLVPGSVRSLLLSRLRERGLSERRWMSFVRVRNRDDGAEVCVCNLHASARRREEAERQIRRAAEAALAWGEGAPLLLGGDFNVRPRSSRVFEELEREFGLKGATAPDAIDHLLYRGLEPLGPPVRWPPERRELVVPWGSATRRIRLSDHTPVEAEFVAEAP